MASLSLRSSKKIEGLTTRSSARNNVREPPGNSHHAPTQQLSNIRKKRSRESADEAELSLNIKKAKFTVEIPSKAKAPAIQSVVVNGDAIHHPRSSPIPDLKRKQAKTTQTQLVSTPPRTNHQQKVVNGIRHELDRLGPKVEDLKAAEKKEQKRSLRSQEGSRFKSDLSTYFPEYDEVIGNDPKEEREFKALVHGDYG